MVPLVRRIRELGQPQGTWARLARDQRLEDLSQEDIKAAVRRVVGETAEDLLQMAGANLPPTMEELRTVLHHSIVLANEVGQPLARPPDAEVIIMFSPY